MATVTPFHLSPDKEKIVYWLHDIQAVSNSLLPRKKTNASASGPLATAQPNSSWLPKAVHSSSDMLIKQLISCIISNGYHGLFVR